MRPVSLIGSLVVLACAVGVALAALDRSCPMSFPLADCKVSIAGVRFATELDCGDVKLREPLPDKYRFAVVTLRITKPTGQALAVPAADLTLHYRRGDEGLDVAPCEAMSSAFTLSQDQNRPLRAHRGLGPGWLKTRTGPAARAASTVYLDAVFARLPQDVSSLWVCIAQPASPGYPTPRGWDSGRS